MKTPSNVDAMRKAAAARPGTGGEKFRMDVALGPAGSAKAQADMRVTKKKVGKTKSAREVCRGS